MIRNVRLTSQQPLLSAKYSKGDTVVVECDATDGAFTTYLPNYGTVIGTLFVYKKVDSSANAVTVETVDGESLD